MKKLTAYKISAIFLALAASILFSGCATIIRGTKEILVVDSNPQNAFIRLSNGMTGYTPASFSLPRNSVLTCTIEKEGYKPYIIDINHQISNDGTTGMIGNVLFGGVIGVCVDATSGATQDLTPNPVFAELEPLLSFHSCSTNTWQN